MSELAGDYDLDEALAAFAEWTFTHIPYMCDTGRERPVAELRDGDVARGQCVGVSIELDLFLGSRGIKSRPTLGQSDGSLDACGYQDRPLEGLERHWFVVAESGGRTYSVDFTASQYGYTEFPLVQRLGADGAWQREWA